MIALCLVAMCECKRHAWRTLAVVVSLYCRVALRFCECKAVNKDSHTLNVLVSSLVFFVYYSLAYFCFRDSLCCALLYH